MFTYVLIVLVIICLAYVRLAPSPAKQFHVSITATENTNKKGRAIRIVPNSAGAMKTLNNVLSAIPRTTLLAGSEAEGHVTYVTRSKVFGFPDYTTLEQSDDVIKMYGRLRFGRKDMGVNAARLGKLIGALD
jgi:uncharacterized protein (DUF1499 family)